MTTRLTLWSTALALAGTIMVVPVSTQVDFSEERHEERLGSKDVFFENSGLGAVAMMPNVTSENNAPFEREYFTLGSSGRYGLDPNREEGWFVVNHRISSGALEGHTYVGVLIAKQFSDGLERERELELYRNDKWHDAPRGFRRTIIGKGWRDFLALQDSTHEGF